MTVGVKDKVMTLRIPQSFYDEVATMVDGIEIQSFSQLVLVSLKRFHDGSKPPPRPRAYNTLVNTNGDIYGGETTIQEEEDTYLGGGSKGGGSTREEGQKGEPVKRRKINYSSDFESFWREYPNSRGSKEKAFDEYKALLMSDVSSGPELLAGVRVYAMHCLRDKTEPKFIKQPVYWLKDRRWEDDDKSGGFRSLPPVGPNTCTEPVVFLERTEEDF
jgi:hypothetical protein